MPANMRGLTVFIADMRNCRTREQEEKRVNKELSNIRTKFKEGHLSGYHRRKYICKLLYIYILGWNVDFGHLEAVELIVSPRYSEKQIGYMAVCLFLSEKHEMTRLVMNSVKKDLESGIEVNACLALHAVANLAGSEMAETLARPVINLLRSSSGGAFVRKKAALCLLRMFRKFPSAFVLGEIKAPIEELLDHPDLGVVLCVSSLVTEVARKWPDAFRGSISKALDKLHRIVIGNQYSPDDVYYKVPAPWLQVKLLGLLRTFPVTELGSYASKVEIITGRIIRSFHELPKHAQQKNAQNAILLEAIYLTIHLNPNGDLMKQASDLFERFLSGKETNVRYLGLHMLAELAEKADSLRNIQNHQETVLRALKDRDISVRRKALDVLYAISDSSNVQTLVHELLRTLVVSDGPLQDGIVTTVFMLVEESTRDSADGNSWYVDVLIQLVTMAGRHVSDTIWWHIVRKVTNNKSLAASAAEKCFAMLKSVDEDNEAATRLGAYILGEFGHSVSQIPGYPPSESFALLCNRLRSSTPSTQALILNALVKIAHHTPSLTRDVRKVIDTFKTSLDMELQQRACEYDLLLSSHRAFLDLVFAEMPEFADYSSNCANSLCRRTSIRSGNAGQGNESLALLTARPNGGLSRDLLGSSNEGIGPSDPTANNDLVSSDFAPAVDGSPRSLPQTCLFDDCDEVELQPLPMPQLASILTHEGILCENPSLQLAFRGLYQAGSTRFQVTLFIGNKTPEDLERVKLSLSSPTDLSVSHNASSFPPVISSMNQIQHALVIECLSPFKAAPKLVLEYGQGRVECELPLRMNAFVAAVGLDLDEMQRLEKDFGTSIAINVKSQIVHSQFLQTFLEQLHLHVIKLSDQDFSGAAMMCCAKEGQLGCLVRVSRSVAKSRTFAGSQGYVITSRSDDERVRSGMASLVADGIRLGQHQRAKSL